MMRDPTLPKEGDLYKIFTLEGHTFEIRYGYYEENERGRVEPLPVYPDFLKDPHYTARGEPITSLIQMACPHYRSGQDRPEYWCGDCAHYSGGKAEIGICRCPERKRE